MRRPALPDPDQLPLELTADVELEQVIEARVARRCQAESVRWKFRLVLIETVMMGVLVAAAGIALDQPGLLVARAAILVAASCFLTGVILLAMTAWSARLLTLLKQRRRS